MTFRDRIKEFRRVRASELAADPRNYRRHPARQRKALESVLTEVGFAGAALARVDTDGRIVLIDGHLRAETCGDEEIPVLILDVDEAEAGKILATHDPLAAMAEFDSKAFSALTSDMQMETADFGAFVKSLEHQRRDTLGQHVAEQYLVIVTCADEREQRSLIARLMADNLKVKAVLA